MHVVVSQGELARRAGVSAMAISKAVKAGLLVRRVNGIDLSDKHTIAYLKTPSDQRHRASGKKRGKSPQPPAPSQRKPKSLTQISAQTVNIGAPAEDDSDEVADLNVAIKQEDLTKKRLDNEIKKGNYIPRALVHIFLAHRYEIDQAQIKPLADRVGAQICGLARGAQTMDEGTIAVIQAISKDTDSMLAHIKRLNDEFLASLETNEPDEPSE